MMLQIISNYLITFLIVYLLLQRINEKEKEEMETLICICRGGEGSNRTISTKVSYADKARE